MYSTEELEQALDDLTDLLFSWGLMEHEVLILTERDINHKTFRAICDEHGYLDVRQVAKIYRQAAQKAQVAYNRKRGD